MKYFLYILSILWLNSSYIQGQLIKNNFFEGLILDGYLEKGEYTSKDREVNPILCNQWNLSGDANLKKGFNPVMGSPLLYDGYPESGKSFSFIQPKLTNGESRGTGYSLTSINTYSLGAYYLAFLLNVKPTTNVTTLNPGIIMFDRSYLVLERKVGVSVAVKERGYSYKIGVIEDDAADGRTPFAYIDKELIFGKTYLVVLKYDFETGKAGLFLNPSLTSVEPEVDVSIQITETTVRKLKESGIQAITVRQRTNHSEVISGLRFAKSWAAAIGADSSYK